MQINHLLPYLIFSFSLESHYLLTKLEHANRTMLVRKRWDQCVRHKKEWKIHDTKVFLEPLLGIIYGELLSVSRQVQQDWKSKNWERFYDKRVQSNSRHRRPNEWNQEKDNWLVSPHRVRVLKLEWETLLSDQVHLPWANTRWDHGPSVFWGATFLVWLTFTVSSIKNLLSLDLN